MILIGSRALILRAPNLLRRKPKDFDFVCTQEECDSWIKNNYNKINPTKVYTQKNKVIAEGQINCEFEIIKPNTSSQMLVQLVASDENTLQTSFGLVPSLNVLFTIKSSHKYLKNSSYFWKTLLDYHMMKQAGAEIPTEYKDFFALREKETYTYSHPKLNTSKENFFKDDNIPYFFDHDDIHKSVACFSRPAYTYYIKDGEQVQCDKNKFFACSREIQLAGVIEESCVLAIEKSLVPHPGKWSPEQAWKFALSKVCSSITSGWFREFSYDNALHILSMYPKNYWEKFQKDVSNGKVRKFKET